VHTTERAASHALVGSTCNRRVRVVCTHAMAVADRGECRLMAHMRRAQSARERQCVLPLRHTPLRSFRQLLLSGVVLLRCFGGALVAVAAAMMHGGMVAPL
jgi:hypothetical protein